MRRIGLAVVLAGRRDRPLGGGDRTRSFHAGIRCRRWLLGGVAAASCVLRGVQIGDSLGWTPGLTRLSSGPATTTVNRNRGMRGRHVFSHAGKFGGTPWPTGSAHRVHGFSVYLSPFSPRSFSPLRPSRWEPAPLSRGRALVPARPARGLALLAEWAAEASAWVPRPAALALVDPLASVVAGQALEPASAAGGVG